MFTFPSLRKRIPAQPVVSGAIVRIMQGVFGTGAPFTGIAQTDARPSTSIYNYHQGDVFLPGTRNFVFESIYELPLQTIWGNAFLRTPNTFNPIQGPQALVQPTLTANGIGGVVAGDMELQSLINPQDESAPFQGDWTYDTAEK